MRTNWMVSLTTVYQMDNSIFSDYTLPDGMDRELVTSTILDYCGSNEVRYADPSHLHMMINNFFDTYAYKYEKLWETITLEYDLLLNFDLTTEETRKHEGGDTTTREGTNTPNITNTNTVSAFNSSAYQPDSRVTQTGTTNVDESEKFETDRTETITSRVYGDNSARSTQYNIQEQRDLVNFNLYLIIASDFEDAITIPVY